MTHPLKNDQRQELTQQRKKDSSSDMLYWTSRLSWLRKRKVQSIVLACDFQHLNFFVRLAACSTSWMKTEMGGSLSERCNSPRKLGKRNFSRVAASCICSYLWLWCTGLAAPPSLVDSIRTILTGDLAFLRARGRFSLLRTYCR